MASLLLFLRVVSHQLLPELENESHYKKAQGKLYDHFLVPLIVD